MSGRREGGVIVRYGRLVAFTHTIFALPFAMSMAVVASGNAPVTLRQMILILVALVSARTSAMAFNRAVDARLDGLNPRTSQREIPSGGVSLKGAWGLFALATSIFLASAFLLGSHCAVLALPVLAILIGYSWTKRWTWSSHFALGLALACAPGGVWWALVGTAAIEPIVIMLAVLFWVAGFDMLYSCQDVEFDRAHGLHSFPARWGISQTFTASKVSHLLSVVLLIIFGSIVNSDWPYWFGLAGFSLSVVSQYRVVSPSDLSRINIAFFTRNGIASVIFFVGVLVDSVLYG